MTLRAIKSVLHNFLGTFTSRYTEYNRYSFWGFVLPYLDSCEIDLLKKNRHYSENVLLDEFSDLACKIFLEQLRKHKIEMHELLKANLTFIILAPLFEHGINNPLPQGSTLKVLAEVQTIYYKIYCRTISITVWKHDPAIEFQSVGK